MPVVVGLAGPAAATMSHDVAEKQVLTGMDGEAQAYWLHLLMLRLDNARWVTVDPNMDMAVEDLSGEELIPVARGMPLPAAGRPYLVHDAIGEGAMIALRARAVALADIHGGAPLLAPLSGPSSWYHADPSLANFGQEVPMAQLSDPASTRMAGSVGLLRKEGLTADAAVWSHIERVTRTDLAHWMAEKREGAGRDPRLSALAVREGTAPRALFRDAMAACPLPATFPDASVFEGPSALQDLLVAMERSGLEPQAYTAQFLRNSGLSPKSSVGIEVSYAVHTIYLFMVHDRLNPYASSAMEHIARRVLQIQRATQRNPRGPDFDGLEEYMRHTGDHTGAAVSLGFDKHVAERQKTESLILKQHRLQREELEHDDKRKKNRVAAEGHKEKNDKAPKGCGKGDQ